MDVEASPRSSARGISQRFIARRGLLGRSSFAIAIALVAANCSGSPKTFGSASGQHPSELKYGVRSSPRVIPEGQPIPKGGGREMVGQPYSVAGRTYTPHDGKGYDREGFASWYGTAFHGRLTANGEVFDRESIAAAHPTLPLPSYVRVTNAENGRSMIVRVNDRGPYERGRLIDLSERAADALGFHRRGTSRVRVQYVGRASIKGSDDTKLLATLKTNGSPAHLGRGEKEIMIADARKPPEPTASAAKTTLVGLRGTRPLPDYEETLPPPAPPRSRLASADEAKPQPMNILPPARPGLGRIY